MAKKQAIQTNLLGRKVSIGGTGLANFGPPPFAANQDGEIVTVFYGNDGELKYTILVTKAGKLVDLYPHDFLI